MFWYSAITNSFSFIFSLENHSHSSSVEFQIKQKKNCTQFFKFLLRISIINSYTFSTSFHSHYTMSITQILFSSQSNRRHSLSRWTRFDFSDHCYASNRVNVKMSEYDDWNLQRMLNWQKKKMLNDLINVENNNDTSLISHLIQKLIHETIH